MIGQTELLIVLVIIIVVFGATRLPQLGSGIGKAISNFKKSVHESEENDVTPDKDSEKETKKEEISKEKSE